ncbi:MAG: phosphatase PAP2 family protein [Candidatus Acidiferrum sp.]
MACAVLAVLPLSAFAQQRVVTAAASGINPEYTLPAYSSARASPADAASFPAPAAPQSSNQVPGEDREVSWRKLPLNILHDQKDLWLFPLELGRGRHLLPALFITAGTATFLATDPQVMPHFRKTTDFHDFNRVFSGTSTNVAMAAVPAVFYAAGLLCKDSYAQSTALFAGEAVVDSTILMVVTKAITRRARPTERPIAGPYNDTFFHTNSSALGTGSSFPSGHSITAFSVATIFARRYRDHRWVPYVAYAAATAIAFSRVTAGAHFPADVFLGSSLGYVIARYDVLRGQ